MTSTPTSSSCPTPAIYPTRDRSASSTNPDDDGGYFDAAKAAAAVNWVEKNCHHTTGEWAGRPFILDPHAKQFFEDVYGWRRYEDGTRLYRESFDAEGRKNGKTTRAGALGLALAFGDNEPRAQVYSIAGNKAQASIVHTEAKGMPGRALAAEIEILKNVIYCPRTGSSFQPLASKASTQHGLNPHGVIGDEVHEWAGREQYDVMHTAVGARRQPFEFEITTAGDDLTSLCWELWDYAKKVRDGIHKDRAFLPIIYEADKDDDPGDPATWAKANPNLGRSIKLEYLKARYERALLTPGAMNAFKRLHLNIWTEAADKWMPLSVWNDQANAAVINENDLIGRPCFAGLDLAWKHDISALVLVFPPIDSDPRWYVVCRFFLPEQGISDRARRDRVPYDVWAASGLLTLTPGNVTDFDVLKEEVFALWSKFKPTSLGFDRFMAGQTINDLTTAGIDCVGIGQGFISTALPMAELDRAVHGRTFRHGGNPILAWMASNVVVQTDPAGNMKPDKKRSIQRIDGIPATLNAMALALAAKADAPSPYEGRGLIILR